MKKYIALLIFVGVFVLVAAEEPSDGNSAIYILDDSELDVVNDIIFDKSGTIRDYWGPSINMVIPARLRETPINTIGRQAFYKKGLRSVTIPLGVIFISDDAFAFNFLTSVIVPDSVTTIGNFAFSNNQLTSVTIGNNVTSIYPDAFRENKLTSVTIPPDVSSIGSGAFADNPLTSVTIGADVTVRSNNGFDAFYNANGKKAGTYVHNNGQWTMR